MTFGNKARILTESERKYIKAKRSGEDELLPDGFSEKDVKYRLKNKDAIAPANVASLLERLAEDLRLIEDYYRHVNPDRKALKQLGIEVERFASDPLRLWLDEMEANAKIKVVPEDTDELLAPLFDFESVDGADRMSELSARINSIHWVLGHEHTETLLELLWFIRDSSRRDQQNSKGQTILQSNKIAETPWIQYAGRWLGPAGHDLVKRHPNDGNRKAYELTTRGESVLKIIDSLRNSKAVEKRVEREGTDIYAAAKEELVALLGEEEPYVVLY